MNNNSLLNKVNDFNLKQERSSFDWLYYLYIVKRKIWLLIIPAILFGLGAFYMWLSIIPIYEASTSILVSGGKLITGSVRSVIPGVTAQNEISAVKNYIVSGKCIVELINTLGLKMKPEIQQKAVTLSAQLPDMNAKEIANMLFIEQVRKDISVETRGRDIIKISVKHENPQKAYLLTKTLVQVFMDEFQKRQLGGIRGVREFSEEQLAIYKDKLYESEERLKRFKEGVLKSEIDDFDMGKATFERFNSDITTLGVSIRDKEEKLSFLNNKLKSILVTPQRTDNAKISQNKKELFAKINELVTILGKFTWKDPQIIALNNDINEIRDMIRKEVERNVKTLFSEKDEASLNLIVEWNMTQLDIEILNYEKSDMSTMLNKLEKSMTKAPTYEMKLNNLQQEVDHNRRLYLQFLHQSQGTQIEEQIQRRDAEFQLQIIEMAKKPLYPQNTGMKQKLILLCLPILGLAFGGGIIYGLDYLDRSVKDVYEAENDFNLPVWGVIPEIKDSETTGWWRIIWQFLLMTFGTAIAATLIYLFAKGNLHLLQ